MATLFQGELFSLTVEGQSGPAWIERTARPSGESAAHDDELEALARAIESIDAARMSVIVDLRKAPGRNDAQFESRIVPAFHKMLDAFHRRVFLVATEVGKMQLRRLRSQYRDFDVVTDEAVARRVAGVPTPGTKPSP